MFRRRPWRILVASPSRASVKEKPVDAVSLLRQQYKGANDWLEGTMEGVEEALAHWAPPGKAHPIGANYAHILFAEDAFINGTLKSGAPLLFSTWADRTGLSEPQPMQWDWDAWAARVRVDVPATREYARAVYAAVDDYLGAMTDADLTRPVDMSAQGMGRLARLRHGGGGGATPYRSAKSATKSAANSSYGQPRAAASRRSNAGLGRARRLVSRSQRNWGEISACLATARWDCPRRSRRC